MPLTDTQIRALKPEEKRFRTSDGGGLFLEVMPSGRKIFRLSYRVQGRQRTAWIGDYPTIRLADARAKVAEYKLQLRDGVDPKSFDDLELEREAAAIVPDLPNWRDIAED